MTDAPRTVLDYLNRSRRFLEGKRIESARLEAEILLAHVLGCRRLDLYLAYDRALSAGEVDRYRELVTRRAQRVPTAYLTGRREFFGLELAVTPDVLIPRPETELLVEEALEHLRGREAPRVVDVGTGSGCIAVALAARRPDVVVDAVDRSGAALAVARANAERHGVLGRVRLVRGDLLDPFRGAPWDAVVSNPPYVAEADAASLPEEVREHEPAGALFAGPDGLAVLRALAERSAAVLRTGGALLVEVGAGQGDAVGALLAEGGRWRDVKRRKDFAGIERVVAARRA